MQKNNLYDFLIVLLVYIALSCLPIDTYLGSYPVIAEILKIIIQVGALLFTILFTKKKTNLAFPINKPKLINTLVLIPVLVLCVSNFFYIVFVPSDINLSFSYIAIFEIILHLLIAINEELIFRNIYISNMKETTKFKKVLYSTLVFGACHLTGFISSFNPAALVTVGYALFLGFILSTSYVFTGSVFPGIAIHFLFNTFNKVVFESIAPGISSLVTYYVVNILVGVFVAIYIIAVLVINYFLKYKKRTYDC